MRQIDKAIEIDAPIADVFAAIADVKHLPEWVPGVVDVRDIRGFGVGRTHEWTYKMAGVSLRGHCRWVNYQPNKVLTIETMGALHSTWSWIMEPSALGTRLSLEITYDLPVPALGRIAATTLHLQNVREVELALENLRSLVEARVAVLA